MRENEMMGPEPQPTRTPAGCSKCKFNLSARLSVPGWLQPLRRQL